MKTIALNDPSWTTEHIPVPASKSGRFWVALHTPVRPDPKPMVSGTKFGVLFGLVVLMALFAWSTAL
jgi:hypothetical protein